jgi:alpha-ketoglutarate-dependent taurine dioxygenase
VRFNSISFERIPSDYAILKIVEPPNDAGGDTLWASGYEAYDRLSPALQKLAEGLTATHHQVSVSSILDRDKIGIDS